MADINEDILEFAVFCIESVAEQIGSSGKDVYTIIAEKTDVLDGYIIPCYEALHTQGKEYIVNDLIDVIRERGGEV